MARGQVPLRVWLGAVVAVAWLLPSEASKELRGRFIGNMAVAITDGTVTVMTDFPYQSGYSRYNTYPASEIRSSTATTLSLITHKHPDHWEPRLFAKTNWKVVAPADATSGVDVSRVVPPTSRITFGPVVIEPIETPHAGIGHYSYVVTWHGKRLFFSGDTESIDRLMGTKNLDAAFLSPWLYRSAIRSGRPLDAKRVVIYHHEAGEEVPECRDRCTVPKQGQRVPL